MPELFDQPTFDRAGLRPLPPGLSEFTAFSLEPVRLFDRLTAGIAASDPSMTIAFEAFQKTIRDLTGQRLRDDLLPHLGPNLTLYNLPAKGDAPSNFLVGLARGAFRAPDMVVVADVKDRTALARILDEMMAKVSEVYLAKAKDVSRTPEVRVHKLKDVDCGYTVSISPTFLPVPAGFRPTLILGRRALYFGSTPETARGAAAPRGATGRPWHRRPTSWAHARSTSFRASSFSRTSTTRSDHSCPR